MTDRELLELAARGAGYRVHGVIGDRFYVVNPSDPAERFDPFAWNPLKDDGDALRLMVRLQLQVRPNTHDCLVYERLPGHTTACVKNDGDLAAATRRAIVLTAAEIGRAA